MRIFTTKSFARFASKVGLTDASLCDAVASAERGLVDADLGGGLIKQRIARSGEGKSGGFRTIIVFATGVRSVFLYGYEKSDRENIDRGELKELRRLANQMLSYTDADIRTALTTGALCEVKL